MTKDDIIRMAQEAGLLHESDTAEIIAECGVEIWLSPFDGVAMLGRFAALVAAHEREACAKVCENRMLHSKDEAELMTYSLTCKSIAMDIRARSNT